MITGTFPWADEMDEFSNAYQLIFKIANSGKGPSIPAQYKLSPELTDFINSCFIIDPEKRPTIQQLLEHIFLNSISSSVIYEAEQTLEDEVFENQTASFELMQTKQDDDEYEEGE